MPYALAWETGNTTGLIRTNHLSRPWEGGTKMVSHGYKSAVCVMLVEHVVGCRQTTDMLEFLSGCRGAPQTPDRRFSMTSHYVSDVHIQARY